MIPGLALNPSVMGEIVIPGATTSYIRWIEPLDEEALTAYAKRLSSIYKIIPEDDNYFVGHSFGGLMAQHLGRIFPNSHVIIISSIKTASELPKALRFLRSGYAYHLATKSVIKRSFKLWGAYFGYDNALLKDALLDELETLDDTYLIWAYKHLINWEAPDNLSNLLHIHGSRDKTFALSNIQDCSVITGGDHLMVAKRAHEINEIIGRYLHRK